MVTEVTTVFSFKPYPNPWASRQTSFERSRCLDIPDVISPLRPRPIKACSSSSDASIESPSQSRCGRILVNHSSVILVPLETMLVVSPQDFATIIHASKYGWSIGSPPTKLIFFTPLDDKSSIMEAPVSSERRCIRRCLVSGA